MSSAPSQSPTSAANDRRNDTRAIPSLERDLAAVQGSSVDLVVVGGGITGAGVARHAALSGLSVLLLEAADFGSGTSSRSTKLIHGGLRYLAMGDFALVREAALERKIVHEIAPHLAEPRWMVLPTRSRLDWLKYGAAVKLYEMLGAVDADDRYSTSDLAPQGLEPTIDWEAFPRARVYREYLTDDARLVLATLRSAARHGARCLNYARVASVEPAPLETGETGYRVGLEDQLGDVEPFTLSARAVVNAAGPWAESLLPTASGQSRLRLSKGVHIVLPRAKLPVQHLVMIGTDDGRMLFVISRGRYTYVGTTDTPYDEPPTTWPRVTAEDVAYLLKPLGLYFPDYPVTESDVAGSWAGLRPLVNEPGKAPKEMSRKDEIWQIEGFITIAGGKLTGFRRMAEEVMTAVGDYLDHDVAINTASEPLCGGDLARHGVSGTAALIERVSKQYQQPAVVATRLVRLYGADVFDVLGDAPVPVSASVFVEEINWAVRVESAQTLTDLVYRRLQAAWFQPDELRDALPRIADHMAELLGWAAAERDAMLSDAEARLATDLDFMEARADV
ncbi:MAG: glycerol-3-phosphate dehydrogenase/oxidase [Pseudomonadota bacterium]